MASRVAFPGEHFPAFPSLSIEQPDSWQPIVVPDTVLAVAEPEDPGAFRTNACVSVGRTVGTRSIEDAAAAVAAGLERAEQYAEVGRAYQEIAGLPGFRIEGSFFVENVGTLFQAAHVAVLQHGEVTDTIVAVATVTASKAQEAVPMLRAVLDSLQRDA